MHLRALIRGLMEEIEGIRKKHGIEFTLDAGILELLKKQMIDGLDMEAIIALFRPPAKIIEVPVYVESPVFQTVNFEKSIAMNIEKNIVTTEKEVQIVEIKK